MRICKKYRCKECPLPSGGKANFPKDDRTYFANQIETGGERCYGVVSDGSFLLVVSYGCEGKTPSSSFIKPYKSLSDGLADARNATAMQHLIIAMA